MHGVKNVYGILSTHSSWRFFRLVPEAEDVDGTEEAGHMLEDMHIAEPRKKIAMKDDSFLTPQKARTELDVEEARNSPPMSPKPYCDMGQGEEDEEEENDSTDQIKRGTLYASAVISDGPRALKTLAWVLGEMAAPPICHIPAYERDYLYVVQKDALGGYEKLEHQ